jgi:iron(III) transport system ATP-binding protein
VAVLRDGRIEQVGSPEEVYERPSSRWVAEFLGEADVLPGTAEGGFVRCELGRFPTGATSTGPVQVVVRPSRGDRPHRRRPRCRRGARASIARSTGTISSCTSSCPAACACAAAGSGFPAWHPGDRVRVWLDGPVNALEADDHEPAGTAR